MVMAYPLTPHKIILLLEVIFPTFHIDHHPRICIVNALLFCDVVPDQQNSYLTTNLDS